MIACLYTSELYYRTESVNQKLVVLTQRLLLLADGDFLLLELNLHIALTLVEGDDIIGTSLDDAGLKRLVHHIGNAVLISFLFAFLGRLTGNQNNRYLL